jgi:hypothetical protein
MMIFRELGEREGAVIPLHSWRETGDMDHQSQDSSHSSNRSCAQGCHAIATKVYNGLLWHLRKEYEETGKTNVSRKNLNRILKKLPGTKGYCSMSVQLTRDSRNIMHLDSAGKMTSPHSNTFKVVSM